MKVKFLFITAVLFTNGLSVCGQSISDTIADIDLRPVVVTSQFAPTALTNTVNVVRVIPAKTIGFRASGTLTELLQSDPNIRINEDPVLGSAISINGIQGENVSVLMDGVPVIGRLNGSVDASQISLSQIRQVEIIEGAQSLMYGSGSSGGVINLVTRASQVEPLEFAAGGHYEEYGYRRFNARLGYQLDRFYIQMSGEALSFSPALDTSFGRDQIWNPKMQYQGRGLIRYTASDQLDMHLTFNRFSEKVDNLGELRRPQYKPYAFDDYYFTDRTDVAWQGQGRLHDKYYWQSTLSYNWYDRLKTSYRVNFEDDAMSLLEGQQDTSASTSWLTRVAFASDLPSEKFNFLIGFDNTRETASGVRIIDTTLQNTGFAFGNDAGIFGSIKKSLGMVFTLQAGSRWTINNLYGSAFTPAYWFVWQPNQEMQVKLSYANGFRSPGMKELYFQFIDINHFIEGNLSLKPERSNTARADILWKPMKSILSGFSTSTSFFYNKIRNRIILTETSPGQYTYENLDNWQTIGGGAGISFDGLPWLQASLNITATGFYNTYFKSNDLVSLYNWSADWTSEVTFVPVKEKFFISLWHKSTGPTPYFFKEGDLILQGRTTAWTMFNSTASWQISPWARIQVGVKNIFDVTEITAQSEDSAGHNGGVAGSIPVHQGRTFFISCNLLLSSKQKSKE